MYYSDFNGLDFLRVHAGMSLSFSNGMNGGTSLGSLLPGRELHGAQLSPTKESPPQGRASPRPGSASATPANLQGMSMNFGLNPFSYNQTPNSESLKLPPYSPPPPASSNPDHNVCKLIDFRGTQIASFAVDNRDLICLPQAFDLFLKHLVGGLHTVYTKLKRLEITPVVCNVEQVRILRGLGAIQPGVNRCKLISCLEFDTLYEDCTNSNARPGRPAKRVPSTNLTDADVLETTKHRKLECGVDSPYNIRFYDRKSMMNNFPGMSYPPMPQLSNFFNMHHLMHPLTIASHIGLRSEDGVPKPDRIASESGIVSPRFTSRSRDERLPMLFEMYAASSTSEARLSQPERESYFSDKPLNLQMNEHLRDKDFEESITEDECDVSDEKVSYTDRQDEDRDNSCDSEDRSNDNTTDKSRTADNCKTHSIFPEAPRFSDFESLVAKFNAVVEALVDAAKTVERRVGEERNHICVELLREKERCLELEKEMREEKKRREFFQRRVHRLKKAFRFELTSITNKPAEKTESPEQDSNPDLVVIHSHSQAHHKGGDKEVEVVHVSPLTVHKSQTDSSMTERFGSRRDVFETLNHNRTALTSDPIKVSSHLLIRSTDV